MMVVLDTNFITIPAQFKIDVFEEIRKRIPGAKMATVAQVITELQKLGSNGNIGIELLKKLNIQVVEKQGKADDALLELAIEEHGLLCTNDKELKKRALDVKVPVMFMRKKKILEITGGLDV